MQKLQPQLPMENPSHLYDSYGKSLVQVCSLARTRAGQCPLGLAGLNIIPKRSSLALQLALSSISSNTSCRCTDQSTKSRCFIFDRAWSMVVQSFKDFHRRHVQSKQKQRHGGPAVLDCFLVGVGGATSDAKDAFRCDGLSSFGAAFGRQKTSKNNML